DPPAEPGRAASAAARPRCAATSRGHDDPDGGRSGALAMVLQLEEAAVEGRAAAQFRLGADGLDAALVHQDDPVGELERAEVVGDQEGGPAARELLDRPADQRLVLDVDGAG